MNKTDFIEKTYTFAAFYTFTSTKMKSKELVEIQKEITLYSDTCIGLIVLAKEGINGTVAGQEDSVRDFVWYLKGLDKFQNVECKFSQATLKRPPFKKLKVKIKREIVTLGRRINTSKYRGEYIEPEEWNSALADPNTLVLDVRNVYEHRIGTFANAVDPKTLHFRFFPQVIKKIIREKKPKKIVMFCTGGIRCEKASAYIRRRLRFKNVFQLHGGILKYFEKIPSEESMWNGKCFVFDGRITVNQNLEAKPEPLCKTCGQVMLKDKISQLYKCFQCIEYPLAFHQ